MAKKPVITKIEAVRQALAALGKEAASSDLVAYAKKELGVELADQTVANYKSLLTKKIVGVRGRGRPRTRPVEAPMNDIPQQETAATQATQQATPHTTRREQSVSLDDIQALKDLRDKLGVAQIQRLLQILT